MMRNQDRQMALNDDIFDARTTEQKWLDWSKTVMTIADATAEALPKEVGFSFDAFSVLRGAIKLAAAYGSREFDKLAFASQLDQLQYQHDKEVASLQEQIELAVNRNWLNYATDLQQLAQMLRSQSSQRLELFSAGETLSQPPAGIVRHWLGDSACSKTNCVSARKPRPRSRYRYKDMAFRIFRNDALQKYRAQFDLAAT